MRELRVRVVGGRAQVFEDERVAVVFGRTVVHLQHLRRGADESLTAHVGEGLTEGDLRRIRPELRLAQSVDDVVVGGLGVWRRAPLVRAVEPFERRADAAGGAVRVEDLLAPQVLDLLVADAGRSQDGVEGDRARAPALHQEALGVRFEVELEGRLAGDVELRLELARLLPAHVRTGLQLPLVGNLVLLPVDDEAVTTGDLGDLGYADRLRVEHLARAVLRELQRCVDRRRPSLPSELRFLLSLDVVRTKVFVTHGEAFEREAADLPVHGEVLTDAFQNLLAELLVRGGVVEVRHRCAFYPGNRRLRERRTRHKNNGGIMQEPKTKFDNSGESFEQDVRELYDIPEQEDDEEKDGADEEDKK